MKKTSAVLCVSLMSLAAAAFAQREPIQGIYESTDPAKAAEVERRAAELQASQEKASAAQSSGASESAAPGKRAHPKKHGAMHRKHKAGEETPSGASGNAAGQDTGNR